MPLKRKKQPKKHSSTYWRKKCVWWAKIKAKERDGYQCQFCGIGKDQKQIHASHILPEEAYPLMSAEPFNIIALCATHHTGGWFNNTEPSWHEDPMYFSDWFNNKWPRRYKKLRAMAEEKKKHIVNWEKQWSEINST